VLGARLTAVHVKDPYLKQFASELYAQGRQAYQDHVDACLTEIADQTVAAFTRAANRHAVTRDAGCGVAGGTAGRIEQEAAYEVKIRHGSPRRELLAEVREGHYDLLVLGGRQLTGIRRWQSRNLPGLLKDSLPDLPILVVPALASS
jgi:nucleotide-binding universal stress UspA family protein